MTTSRPLPKNFADELTSTPYKHVRALARGGMGEVHVVEHRELGGQLVLKVIRAHLLEQEEHLTLRLRAEGRALRAVRHPNLVDVVDFGFTNAGRAFLVTELLIGETLKEALKVRSALPFPEVKELLRQVLWGLIAAHDQHVVHRDIKPDNLFWCNAERDGKRVLKILDFGVAKLLTEEAKARVGQVAATKTGMVVGTPLYLSPEQALAQAIDERADLYSVAAVGFHLAVGRPPFVATPGPSAQIELLQAHLSEQPPTPSTLASVPLAFDAWVHKGMAKAPDDRFASAREMLEVLDGIGNEATLTPTPAAVSAPAATPASEQASSPRRSKHGTIPMSASGLQSPLSPVVGPPNAPSMQAGASGANHATVVVPPTMTAATVPVDPAIHARFQAAPPAAHPFVHRPDLAAAVAPLRAVVPAPFTPRPTAPNPVAPTAAKNSRLAIFAVVVALVVITVVASYVLGIRM